ncbi:OLC1v1008956C1 [Oldenlandia corymbosa var. corymbosa]|uniref:Cell division control protein n=1 Tax=Oldenlandia corymbosa var. corymbosa TaxID=529605 RepID=A0AAV1DMW2_OLDCO|nr:OLC1v1008956C1 [Oldenlandia corymbosa var. corymbosa]
MHTLNPFPRKFRFIVTSPQFICFTFIIILFQFTILDLISLRIFLKFLLKMPTIAAGRRSSPVAISEVGDTTPQKRKLRSNSAAKDGLDSSVSSSPMQTPSPLKRKSPRRCLNDSPKALGIINESTENGAGTNHKAVSLTKSPVKRSLSAGFFDKPIWNATDVKHLNAVKEALHVSTSPSAVVCRENEQNTILEFCKRCVEQESSGSMYICGCPGTGKSLIMEKVKDALVDWAKEGAFQPPDLVSINCTSLVNSTDVFSKILGKSPQRKKNSGSSSPLKILQNSYSLKPPASGLKMTLIIADEMDYLITKDRSVLHDLFMLTTLPFSRCILIGVANAIDLADRFLPKLQSLNCKPRVITFRAYSKDQIIAILQQRLAVLPYIVFQPQALELCARRVAAASGDLRKALCVCRSAIEMLEAEIRDSAENLDPAFVDGRICHGDTFGKQDNQFVRVDHMALALSKAYKSPVVDIIQSLPQHQQIILCSAVKLFRGSKKKDTTISELNKCYVEFCKSTLIPPLSIMELSNMCRVLADQGLIKLGQAREDKLRRVMLKVDEADINFALQGVRFFRNCLQT